MVNTGDCDVTDIGYDSVFPDEFKFDLDKVFISTSYHGLTLTDDNRLTFTINQITLSQIVTITIDGVVL